jgi:hypothetical protein
MGRETSRCLSRARCVLGWTDRARAVGGAGFDGGGVEDALEAVSACGLAAWALGPATRRTARSREGEPRARFGDPTGLRPGPRRYRLGSARGLLWRRSV